jgi:hypothetical protein
MIRRTIHENGRQRLQGPDGDRRRSQGHRRARGGVTHPGRQLAQETRAFLDEDDIVGAAPRALHHP